MREVRQDGSSKTGSSDFQNYARVLWRKKYFVIAPAVLAGLVAVVGLRFVSPVYESSSIVLMQGQRYLGEEMNKLITARVEEDRTVKDKEVLAQTAAEIESPIFLDELVEELGISQNPRLVAKARTDKENAYPDMSVDELVRHSLRELLKDKIDVSLAGPGMYKIACYDVNPETSYMLATRVTNLFIESRRVKYLRGLRKASEFTDEQVAIYRDRLAQSELELDRIKERMTNLALRKNPVGETSPGFSKDLGGESNLRLAETLKAQLDIAVRETEDIVGRTERRLATALGYLPNGTSVWQDPDIKNMQEGLAAQHNGKLLLDLRTSGVTDESRAKVDEAIRELESGLQRRLVEVVDAQFPDVAREYRPLIVEYFYQIAIWRGLQNKLSQLGSYISGFKEQLSAVPLLQTELTKLENEVATNREIYNSFLRAKTSAQVSEAAQNTGVEETIDVLERPSRPLYPIKPKKALTVLLALVLGAGLGLTGLVVSEYTDTSFRSVEDVEKRLGLRVLGTIPVIEDNADWSKARSRKQLVWWFATTLLVAALSLGGFYYYGKIANRQATHVHTTKTSQK